MHAVHELGVFEGVESDGLLDLLAGVELWLGKDPLVVRPEESGCLWEEGEREGEREKREGGRGWGKSEGGREEKEGRERGSDE